MADLPPRRPGTGPKSAPKPSQTPPGEPSPPPDAPDDEPLAPGLRMADPNRPSMPAPSLYLGEHLPPAPPAPAPGEDTRTCAYCFTRMPLSHLDERADSLICADTDACQARASASGLYPQPAARY